MRLFFFSLFLSVSFSAAEKPNILLICVDDLRPELGCYGVDYIHSPNIDGLAEKSRIFIRHYVQSPSCGPSRYSLLTGLYGVGYAQGNSALSVRGKKLRNSPGSEPPSLPHWFKKHGYTTVSVGKVSHHVGGYEGRNWLDKTLPEMPYSWDRASMPSGKWEHPKGTMHGLAHGKIRGIAKSMNALESAEGEDSIYPDGLITESSLKELETLKDGEKPFFLAVGFIRPHLPFGAPAKYMEPYSEVVLPPIPHPGKPEGKTTWYSSGEFKKYNHDGRNPNADSEYATSVRKHYAACVSYVDAQVGKVLEKLEELNLTENTIIVLWGDHGWNLGEHGIWGKHSLFEEALLSPLLISYPELKYKGEPTESLAESIDIFPTLCDLAGLSRPDFFDGDSLLPPLKTPSHKGGTAISHHSQGSGKVDLTVRDSTYRLVMHDDCFMELYDLRSPENVPENIAKDHPETVSRLKVSLDEILKDKSF